MGVVLPQVYKQRMARANGGTLSLGDEVWFLFPLRDHSDRAALRRTAEDVQRETSRARADGLGFPDDGIAIGHNGAGDILFLRCDGSLVRDELWTFRMRGGELACVATDLSTLWGTDV